MLYSILFFVRVYPVFKIKFCTATHYAWQLDNTIRYDGLILFANVNVYYYFTSHNKQIYYHRSHCVAKCTRYKIERDFERKRERMCENNQEEKMNLRVSVVCMRVWSVWKKKRLRFSLILLKKKYYLVDLYHTSVRESVLFSRLSPIIFV